MASTDTFSVVDPSGGGGGAAAKPDACFTSNALGKIEFDCPMHPAGHPKWYPPTGEYRTGLKVHNTLTSTTGDTLTEFIPAKGRKVMWYTCGPTVYNSAHMGHARAYLTFDILRRILEDYFRYEVLYHINITDIDDKIILRARRNKLLADFRAESAGDYAAVESAVDASLAAKGAKLEKKVAALAAWDFTKGEWDMQEGSGMSEPQNFPIRQEWADLYDRFKVEVLESGGRSGSS